MTCPHCKAPNNSRVVNSTPVKDQIKRRRLCQSCGGRFTTYERVGEGQSEPPTLEPPPRAGA